MKTLERGWALAPHPDLAALYLKASGENDPLKRVGIARKLVARKPDDLESQLVLAQASLEAGLWGEARRYLQAAGGTNPTVRVCRMMAEVEERAQSDQAKMHEWLAKAATAPADKAWRCSACARASRELALGVRELRRVRHAALARAGHLRAGPAAGSAAKPALTMNTVYTTSGG